MQKFVQRMQQLIPARWFKLKFPVGSVLISGYECLMPAPYQFENGRVVDFNDCLVIWYWGSISHMTSNTGIYLQTSPEGSIELVSPKMYVAESGEKAWLIILQPLRGGAVNHLVQNLRGRRNEVEALLAVVININLTKKFVFENEFSIPGGQLALQVDGEFVKSDYFICPWSSEERIQKLLELEQRIENIGDQQRARIKQAIYWYNKGTRSEGIESFINLWIAMEALLLERSSNIWPLKASIGRAYGLDINIANQRFGIGRIFGLRNQLFHGQTKAVPNISMLAFLGALFIDVLFEQLGLKCERRAEQALSDKDFDSTGWLENPFSTTWY